MPPCKSCVLHEEVVHFPGFAQSLCAFPRFCTKTFVHFPGFAQRGFVHFPCFAQGDAHVCSSKLANLHGGFCSTCLFYILKILPRAFFCCQELLLGFDPSAFSSPRVRCILHSRARAGCFHRGKISIVSMRRFRLGLPFA